MKKTRILLLSGSLLLLASCSNSGISTPNNLVKPNDTVNDTESEIGLYESDEIAQSIENSLKEGTLLEDYGDSSSYLVLRHALNKQAKSPYSLTIGKSKAVADLLGYTQNITSATYITPKASFNQNISTSAIVKTAFRFYDDESGYIKAYEGKTESDWTKGSTPDQLSYDQYIQKYGKLFKGSYYCTDGGDDIEDKYYSDDEDSFLALDDESKREINSIVIYDLRAENISGNRLVETEDGYQVTISLTGDKATYYYQAQMQSTGNLEDKPVFEESVLTFNLSKDLYLVSSHFEDRYSAKLSIISTGMTQTMDQYYFHSETSTFKSGAESVEVEIPDISDTDFSGYNLFPEE